MPRYASKRRFAKKKRFVRKRAASTKKGSQLATLSVRRTRKRPVRGAVRSRKRRVRPMRMSPVAIALAAVEPVIWRNHKQMTTGTPVAGNQHVLLTEQMYSPADLSQILTNHASNAAATAGQSVYILSCKAEMSLTNFDNIGMHFLIYEFRPRLGIAPNAATDPVTYWTNHDDVDYDEGTTLTAAVSNELLTDAYNIPERSMYMRNMYRIKRVLEFDLGAGATKRMVFHGSKKPYKFGYPMRDNASQIQMTPPAKSYVVIGYTLPMVYSVNQQTSVSSGKFGVIIHETYVSKQIHYTPRLCISTNEIAASGAPGFINDATDEVAAETTA